MTLRRRNTKLLNQKGDKLIVRELITRLGFKLDQAQFKKAEKGINRVKGHAQQAAAAFRNMAIAAGGFTIGATIINIADAMQNIRARISLLPQTIGDAGLAFDEVAARASASGVKIEAYSSLYTRLGNAAKEYITTQEDLLSITDTISQALIVGGANTQEAASAMIQFSQALGSGVLQGDEFRTMAEAAPQYLDKLSEVMKIPREELKKMAADGKLTSKEVIEATRKMSDYFQEKFERMPMTVGRAMAVVGNKFSRMVDNINRDSKLIPTIASAILAVLDKVEEGVYKVSRAFHGWGNMVRIIGVAIGVAFGAKALSALSAFRIAALLAMAPFIKMIAIISAATLVIEDFYVWIQGGDSAIGSLLGTFADVAASARWLRGLIVSVADAIVDAFTLGPGLFIAGLQKVGLLLNQVFVKWAQFIYNSIYTPIVTAIADAWNAVKNKFGEALEAARSFVGLGGSGNETSTNNPSANAIAPFSFTPAAMGVTRPNVQSNTNITVTVPAGTTAEQVKFIQTAAQQSFDKVTNDKLARGLAIYAP